MSLGWFIWGMHLSLSRGRSWDFILKLVKVNDHRLNSPKLGRSGCIRVYAFEGRARDLSITLSSKPLSISLLSSMIMVISYRGSCQATQARFNPAMGHRLHKYSITWDYSDGLWFRLSGTYKMQNRNAIQT